ncbi:hypothetical protein [Planotetraspora kaengkrachanensis]|uniref:Uncharacterized protein n=1 Tax=Planotetraspora kaengkrachanensis TaxID=575193 RepID=A0A8J3PX39_9ACTN|nr:hypothetical protein [Planotetraspora kaengkrachanensis]GIG82727.1 hypothetical protein Pka01_58540 [Planotetraspora kaengkrachanensis]
MSLKARASNQRGESIEVLTSEDVRALVYGLSSSNQFVIVERLDAENDEYYMQAHLRTDGSFWLEYREGSADAHFRTSCRDLRLMTQVFTMWLYRLPGWREPFNWTAWPDQATAVSEEC